MLTLRNVSKTFNLGTVYEKPALSHVTLEVNDKDFITIIGSNGAGKSTLFNIISGSYEVDAGYIELDGKDVTFDSEHKRAISIGHLFQDPLRGTAPHMTIEENLSIAYLHAKSKGVFTPFSHTTEADRELFREKVAQLNMGLEDRLDSPVGLLSGGQRQALTLLMATMVPPKLLLLDEHTAALDPATADKVIGLTRNIVEAEGITCLMITHNMSQALELGNRTLMMDKGRIVFDISGTERANMTVNDLLDQFAKNAGTRFDDDRVLLSTQEGV